MLIYKDGIVDEIKRFFPNVSFPTSGIPESFLTDNNLYKVNAFKEHNKGTEKLISCDPYKEGNFVYIVKVVNKTDAEIAAEVAAMASKKRAERDSLLTASDWTQVADAPVDKEAWATYRQALRDLPDQEGFPNVAMPRSPDWVESPLNVR